MADSSSSQSIQHLDDLEEPAGSRGTVAAMKPADFSLVMGFGVACLRPWNLDSFLAFVKDIAESWIEDFLLRFWIAVGFPRAEGLGQVCHRQALRSRRSSAGTLLCFEIL